MPHLSKKKKKGQEEKGCDDGDEKVQRESNLGQKEGNSEKEIPWVQKLDKEGNLEKEIP